MAIYLDSANPAEAAAAAQLGWVSGVTTNPHLLAQSSLSVEETLRKIREHFDGNVFYQLQSTSIEAMQAEAEKASAMLGSSLVLKIPATPSGLQALVALKPRYTCAVTAVYRPSQAYLAAQAGAAYVIVYANRAARLLPEGAQLTQHVAQILASARTAGASTELMAASIKSVEEAESALFQGAQHLTLPLKTMLSLVQHPLSEQAVREFAETGKGL